MTTITFTVHGKPAQMGSKKAVRNKKTKRTYIVDMNDKNKKTWAALVKIAARQAMQGRKPFDGPVMVTVMFYIARTRSHYGTGKNVHVLRDDAPKMWHAQTPDKDKLMRCLGDAMTGIVYVDDKQITMTIERKLWCDAEAEGAYVQVMELLEQNQS
jgi:Holliday junction resolvase RusA-like endonuclease